MDIVFSELTLKFPTRLDVHYLTISTPGENRNATVSVFVSYSTQNNLDFCSSKSNISGVYFSCVRPQPVNEIVISNFTELCEVTVTTCKPGRYGYGCNKSCDWCREGTRCGDVYGECFEGCPNGRWGLVCENHCEGSSTCDWKNGMYTEQ